MGGFGDFLDKTLSDLLNSQGAQPGTGVDVGAETQAAARGTSEQATGIGADAAKLTEVSRPGSQLFKAGQGTVVDTKAQSGVSFGKLLRSGVSTASGVQAFLQKQPELRGPKPPPAGPSEAAAAAAERERRLRGRGGRASTILTTPLGVVAKPNVGTSTLLGA